MIATAPYLSRNVNVFTFTRKLTNFRLLQGYLLPLFDRQASILGGEINGGKSLCVWVFR